MMELSLTLTTFSLLPLIPAELGASEASSWRIASGLYALGAALVAESVALGLNALGAFPSLESGIYFAGLFLHFLAAAFFFIRLLYGAFPRDEG